MRRSKAERRKAGLASLAATAIGVVLMLVLFWLGLNARVVAALGFVTMFSVAAVITPLPEYQQAFLRSLRQKRS